MKKGLLISLFLLFSLTLLHGQTLEEIKKQQAATNAQIEALEKQLVQSKLTRHQGVEQLILVNRKIELTDRLLKNIEDEIALYQRQAKNNSTDTKRLGKKQESLKKAYADLIYQQWSHQFDINEFTLIFSSSSFSQAYSRWLYFNQLNSALTQKMEELTQNTDSLNKVSLDFKALLRKQQKAQQTARTTAEILSSEKRQAERNLKSLQQQESKISKQLEEEKQNKEKLQKEMDRVIAEMARKSSGTKDAKFKLTPSETKLAGEFQNNKGKLPWPVKEGFVSEQFGIHKHVVLSNIDVENSGIKITCPVNADVFCVYNGKVVNIYYQEPYANIVIIRHGNYMTIYTNLEEVNVKVDQEVYMKQKLGRLAVSPQGSSSLEFQVWRDITKLDPQDWLLPLN